MFQQILDLQGDFIAIRRSCYRALLGHVVSFLGISTLTTMLVVSGSAAVAGTVFGAPIAMVLLVLELTYSYDLALAAMLSIVVSSLICHLFFGHSLFDLQLLNRGIDLAKGRVFLELETIRMSELASSVIYQQT